MAIAFQPEWTEAERVLDAAMVGYRAVGAAPRPIALGTILDRDMDTSISGLLCVMVLETRSVEIVLDSPTSPVLMREAIIGLASRDWSVTILTPVDALGSVHSELRAAPCTLQPWWEETGEIAFGAYETP